MGSVAFGMLLPPPALTTTATSVNDSGRGNTNRNRNRNRNNLLNRYHSFLPHLPNSASGVGGLVCRASQVVELFPSSSNNSASPSPPDIVVREARLEDCWGVAETHCTIFFPGYPFHLALLLRINKLLATLFGFSVPNGCKRTCLVAVVIGCSLDDDDEFGLDDGRFTSVNKEGHVAGILTVDTVANFLPRKGPLRLRRTGIAYISNVAVRERFRRKGIAKRLVAKAEAEATSWGCRAMALHCDLNDPAATKLYIGQGFKSIKVPEGANWPRPKTSPDVQFNFMMKLLNTPTTTV